MAVDYTTTALLAAIKRKAFMPSAASLTDTEILTIADEEMRSLVLPALLRVRDDYYVEQADYPIVPNDQTMQVQTIVFSGTVVACSLVEDSTGRAWELPRVSIDMIDRFSSQTSGIPGAYAMQGETLYLLPTPTNSGYSVRVRFERLPGRLVATSAAFQPVNVNSTTGVITGTVPGAWGIGSRLSSWHSQPPFGAAFMDARITAVTASTDVTVSTPVMGSLDDVVYNGAAPSDRRDYPDYVCLWNETCVVPLPDSWHPALVAAAAAAVLSTQGAHSQAERLYAERDAKIDLLIGAQSNRIRHQPKVAFNRESPLRRGFVRGWYVR